MPVTSAGLLLYRVDDTGLLELWLVHPGGPYWTGKDTAAWSVPKGEYGPEEEPREVATREFEEECGFPAPDVPLSLLGRYRQASGKIVSVYAGETDADLRFVSSNTCEIEWPPRSGKRLTIPEVDDARWITFSDAETKLVKGQRPILVALRARLDDVGRRYRTE
ncbi:MULTISPECIES: NUDIX domain-containing protein [unclassified Rhodococcus (in: high G+C Gram-positive bacteria)]|uniref:NUDIX domain-containing protein n=1 Tax=unclassified Rhodococcus (in: high G+C Gram-positive bacteria) TaxID=192944 RepID=UPI00146F3FDA|nr:MULTISPECIES: NUDIX domain-containing protein [unclassified Rhodococcus (in: high G+C Gram-positive bacteria)]MBF0663151.1 NUDIX domain-containing protein [Rhodococcus sp. (in: high G+C Gram-positive bacteria)]NMD95903.1 NUDIX domain-containing protein [Rhodococcus sp. BL-253-APC-6A1W]NME78843.1 NUDIX domain-containing protein [Rhodococcus sp. 105337]